MSDLARALLDELAGDPVALARLRELVGERTADPDTRATPAYTPRTLAAALGRSERSIRAAIARGELAAVKRGRGWILSAEAVQAWATATPTPARPKASRPARRNGKGPMGRALGSGQ